MVGLVNSYFNDLYTKNPNVEPQVLTSLFECCISEEMNMSLCKPYAKEEVADALFQIGPRKAPNLDGFLIHFFQRKWDTLREDVSKVVHAFFVDGHMQKSVNDTAIELIPKVKFSEKVRDYRLISLCIVVYKVVSKCLVNHLRPLLDNSISKNQSALIPNCLITENALIAFECIHAI